MAEATSEVLDLEERRNAAVATGDLGELATTLAEDYLHVWGTGLKTDKAGYIAALQAGPRVHERKNLVVRVYGDTAIINGDLLNTISTPGQPVRVVDAYVTQIAIRQPDGKWLFVSWHITPKQALPA
jgi:ketosteroid isomerase-like protein